MTTPFEALRGEWAELAERSGNVFATPEWAETWWRHYGGDRELLVHAEPGLILPLYLWRSRPLRVARFLGHGPGDQLGPVCAPEDVPRAAEALTRFAAERDLHVLLAEQLPGDRPWPELLHGRTVAAGGSPVLRFEGRSWDELVAGYSRNFREQVRRKERKLFREHEAAFRLSESDRFDADLDVLFRLHGARWRAGSGFSPDEAFQRDFAHLALERGWARLWLLEVDGAPRAAWYGLRYGGADAYYQAGRDPEWERQSVGFVLLAHTIRDAVEAGQTEYRFLRGGESFKYRFASEDPGLVTVAVTRGTVAGVALRAAEAGRRLVRIRAARSSVDRT